MHKLTHVRIKVGEASRWVQRRAANRETLPKKDYDLIKSLEGNIVRIYQDRGNVVYKSNRGRYAFKQWDSVTSEEIEVYEKLQNLG